MKFKKNIVLLFFPIWLGAFDIGSMPSSMGGITSSSGITASKGQSSYFKRITDSVTDCIAGKIAGKIPDIDVCLLEEKINTITSELDGKIKDALNVNVNFNIAGCSFSSKFDPTSCLRGKLKLQCSNRDNPLRKNKVKYGIQNYMSSSSHNVVEYADSEIMGNVCMTFAQKKAKDPVHTKVYSDKKYEKILSKGFGGKYLKSRTGKNILKCVEDAKRNGYDENSCYPQYDNVNTDESKSAITEVEVREAINEEATITLASPLRDKVSDLRNQELDLQEKLSQKCGNESTSDAVDDCVSDYLKSTYKLDQEVSKVQVNVTKNIAAFAEALDDATTPPNVLVFPTEGIAKNLPIEKATKYRLLANKQMAQKAIIQSQIKRVGRIEKELAGLIYKKIEVSAKPFSIKASKEELGLNDESSGSKTGVPGIDIGNIGGGMGL